VLLRGMHNHAQLGARMPLPSITYQPAAEALRTTPAQPRSARRRNAKLVSSDTWLDS
jgi:hypothetical protein